MFERIVVPLDGTAFAEQALAPAEELARTFASRIVVVRALGADGLPAVATPERQAGLERLDDADAYLHRVGDRLRAEGLDAEIALAIAEPGSAVAEAAQVSHADLIVMAAHPRWRTDLLDDSSTTLRVLARTRVALLAWRGAPATAGQPALSGGGRALLPRAESPIVVPLDGSAFAEGALALAEGLAAMLGSYLVLVRAIPDAPGMDDAAPTESDRAADAAAAYLRRVGDEVRRRGVGVEVEVRHGTPVRAIDRAWRERDAALVVMASHGATGPGTGFFGSVAAHAIEDLEAPILVARPALTAPHATPAGTRGAGEAREA